MFESPLFESASLETSRSNFLGYIYNLVKFFFVPKELEFCDLNSSIKSLIARSRTEFH